MLSFWAASIYTRGVKLIFTTSALWFHSKSHISLNDHFWVCYWRLQMLQKWKKYVILLLFYWKEYFHFIMLRNQHSSIIKQTTIFCYMNKNTLHRHVQRTPNKHYLNSCLYCQVQVKAAERTANPSHLHFNDHFYTYLDMHDNKA